MLLWCVFNWPLVGCLVNGCCADDADVDVASGTLSGCDGTAGGCGGLLPGRMVPLFILNRVSPVHVGPCRTLFCCDLLRSWYLSSKSSLLPFVCRQWFLLVVLKSVGWYWTSAIWYEECFSCCPVCSDQKSLFVECPRGILVPENFHSC